MERRLFVHKLCILSHFRLTTAKHKENNMIPSDQSLKLQKVSPTWIVNMVSKDAHRRSNLETSFLVI